MKLTPADIAFGFCIKERAQWICERCGTQYHYPARGLDCSHYISRTNRATRFEPLNAFAHCRGCHQYLGSNPHIFQAWTLDNLGQEKYDILIELSNDIVRGKMVNQGMKSGEIAAYFREVYAEMLRCRAGGVIGWLPFVGWA